MYSQQAIDQQQTQQAIDAMYRACQQQGKRAVLAVADRHGELLGFLRLDGAPLTSIAVAANKARTAARERRPSGEIGAMASAATGGFDMGYYGDDRMTGWGGGLPVYVGDDCIGGVGVSGLTIDEDVAIAQIGVAAILAGAGGR